MKATEKNPAINAAINALTGDNREATIALELCVKPPFGCGQPIEGFTDALSEKEYRISGMCQKCQDGFFK